jgi:hypothetical protein
MSNKKKKRKFESAKDILLSHDFLAQKKKASKYVTKEFQDYGLRLAKNLNDMDHKSLYIKLAKNEDRNLLQKAQSFTMDYPNARNKAKIFMWKLKEIKEKIKHQNQNEKDKQTYMF